MTETRPSPAPLDGLARLDAACCAELRRRLAEVGFTSALIAEADAFFPGVLRGPRLPLIRWWLERRAETGATLARLFLYDDTLAVETARESLTRALFDRLVEAGVLAVTAEGGVRAAFLLYPWFDGLLVLADNLGSGADAVMGPSAGTEHLARMLPAGSPRSALDLGCGAGSLALFAARRGAARSVGVDLNPRANEIAKFNARLNALDVQFVAGDVAAPVDGDTFGGPFDLVLSQPPFVARPPAQGPRTFLHGGERGDELPLRFMATAARVLAPGGRAMILVQAPESDDAAGTLMERIQGALADSRAHVLSIVGDGPAPAIQAAAFASVEDPGLGERYAATARSYLDHFRALGVRAMTGGLVVLSRPAPALDDGRRYALALGVARVYYDGATLEQFLRGLDLVEGRAEAVEGARLRVSSHARIAQEATAAGDAPEAQAVIRVVPPSIGTELRVGLDDLRVLEAVDAAESVGAALDALGRSRPTAATTTPGAAREDLLAFIRRALLHGALVRP